MFACASAEKILPAVPRVDFIPRPTTAINARSPSNSMLSGFARRWIAEITDCSLPSNSGKGVELRKGKDITIFATGLCVSETLKAAETLAADGIDAQVINIHTIKPIDEELIVAAAKETGKVVTVEEHSVIGGLGSAVCDVLSEKLPTPVLKIGVMDTFGESGPAVELIKKYGLDADSICEKVKAFVK